MRDTLAEQGLVNDQSIPMEVPLHVVMATNELLEMLESHWSLPFDPV